MARKKISITLSLEEGDADALEAIALSLGRTWGGSPNISQLIRDLAKGDLLVVPADIPPQTSAKRKAINGAIALIQKGLAQLMEAL